jgi:hypothetical protein
MAKPSVSMVKEWTIAYDSDLVVVENGTAVFSEDYWKVTLEGQRPKYFYGESAWSDAQRMASDVDGYVYF